MPRYHQKDLIILFFGEIPKKRDATGSVRDNPVQRGEPVRAAVVQMSNFIIFNLLMTLHTHRRVVSIFREIQKK